MEQFKKTIKGLLELLVISVDSFCFNTLQEAKLITKTNIVILVITDIKLLFTFFIFLPMATHLKTSLYTCFY
ncbi:hypothetical protein D1614_19495 [Maribellus luteus]|uniref:Uncharacterized protein n=1 Tax=Maribellus luteus TaxID=2305463 RepID=A0A399SS88_9BACT|nr:hypothetical protein D1614_19495 [Maribellus luteus]